METLLQDLRYGVRSLARQPGFTMGAMLTLALGIGAIATVFGLVNALLLQPPSGVADPGRLVALYTSDYSGPPYGGSSYPDFRDFAGETRTFGAVAAYVPAAVGLGTGANLESHDAEAVSAGYFTTLGVRPALGRFFVPAEEDAPGDVVVIGYALWQTRLGGARDVVGTVLAVNGRPFTIIGVAPAGFTGFDRTAPVELWLPARAAERAGVRLPGIDDRGSRGIALVARLAPGVSVERASARMRVVARNLQSAYPDMWTDVHDQTRRITVLAEREMRVPPSIRGAVVGLIGLLGATVAVVLLICCANVAGLLLARAGARAREMGIRVSLGAGRARLVRQLMTESALLGLFGAGAGILLAVWSADLLATAQRGSPLGLTIPVPVDGRVLAFTVVVAGLTVLLFGLAPAARAARVDVVSALKAEESLVRIGRARLPLRSALVAGQIALSVVLLVGALLFVRTLRSAYEIDPGFRTDHLLMVNVAPLPGSPESGDPALTSLALARRVAALPGVEAVSWGWGPPFSGFGSRRGMRIEGYEPARGEDMEFHVNHVGPDFFRTLGIPLASGRPITRADRQGTQPVVVVNETFAHRFWPGQDPLGRRISMGPVDYVVVGVARDVHYLSLTASARPYVYQAALQAPRQTLLFVRTAGSPLGLLPALSDAIEDAAPGWVMTNPTTVGRTLGRSLFQQRVAGWVVGTFAAVALALAAIGLYGVIAYAVARRTREVGIRVALGAPPGSVRALFLRQALPIVALGLLLGLAAAWVATAPLEGLLIGVGTRDAAAFLGAPLLLGAVALLSTWLPARRAARMDPVMALRE